MEALLRKLESAMERAKESPFQYANVRAVTVGELKKLTWYANQDKELQDALGAHFGKNNEPEN